MLKHFHVLNNNNRKNNTNLYSSATDKLDLKLNKNVVNVKVTAARRYRNIIPRPNTIVKGVYNAIQARSFAKLT